MNNDDSQVVNIPVVGLVGPGLKRDLSNRLSDIDGLTEINIDLESEIIRFCLTDPGGSNGQIERALDEIRKTGIEIPVQSEVIDIFNLRCAACVNTLENGLKKIPGISNARVNFATQTGRIDLIDGVYDRRKLINDIKNIGYDADFHVDDRVETNRNGQLKRDLIVSLTCAIAIFSLHFGQHIVGLFTLRPVVSALLQLLLTLPVLYSGRLFFIDALVQLRHFRANMNSLIALGSGSAWLYSVVITGNLIFGTSAGGTAIYYDTTAMIIAFILIGRYLEHKATREARDAAEGMSSLIPQMVWRLDADGNEEQIDIGQLAISDTILVRPGQSIPADGIVVEGQTTADESMITGEAMPVVKGLADKVTSGTLNIGNGVKIRVTQVGRGTVLARMIRMVRDAQDDKAPIQRVADRVAAVFVPIVIVIALITLVVWLLISPGSKMALIAPVAVLLVACPCAMGLATPTAILVGTGRASRLGILFRNGVILERLAATDTFIFDKTGTLTEGRPSVDAVLPSDGTTAETLMQFAASAEQFSEHPFGLALREKANHDQIGLLKVSKHEIIPGQGLKAEIEGRNIVMGRRSFMAEASIPPEQLAIMRNIEKDRKSAIVHVALDNNYLGTITFNDTMKSGAAETLRHLKEMGYETMMLTGDNNYSAAAAAARLGIKNFEAEALPEKKLLTIQSLSRTGRVTAMVGDGVNDAAALTAADIGFSLGTGTDIAIKASDITITGKSLDAILTAIEVSRVTLKTIKQNLFWAFFYNVIMIPVAAGALYPIFGITLSPVIAAAAMALSSIFVVANSLRLKNIQPISTEN